jgi:hypothetical protein
MISVKPGFIEYIMNAGFFASGFYFQILLKTREKIYSNTQEYLEY